MLSKLLLFITKSGKIINKKHSYTYIRKFISFSILLKYQYCTRCKLKNTFCYSYLIKKVDSSYFK